MGPKWAKRGQTGDRGGCGQMGQGSLDDNNYALRGEGGFGMVWYGFTAWTRGIVRLSKLNPAYQAYREVQLPFRWMVCNSSLHVIVTQIT